MDMSRGEMMTTASSDERILIAKVHGYQSWERQVKRWINS